VNLLGTPGQRWGSELPSRVHYVVQCTLSRKSSLSEKSERDIPTSEREKYFGVASGSISRVVTEGSRGLGRRVKRQDGGSRIDFKNLRESCSRRSARLGMAAQYRTLM